MVFGEAKIESYHDNRSHTPRLPANNSGFKRRLTQREDDNRFHYLKKIEMENRMYRQMVERSKERQPDSGNRQGVTPCNITGKKEEGHVKNEVKSPLEYLTRSARRDDSLNLSSLLSSGLKKNVFEDQKLLKQPLKQDRHQSMKNMGKEDMVISEYMDEMARKAKMEISKGSTSNLSMGVGPVTVFCLDTSGSMEGMGIQEMVSIAITLVEEIHQACQNGVVENIGVTTFGKTSRVLLCPTDDHEKVKNVLLSLHAEGPSPMFEGICMALAAITEGNERRKLLKEIPFESRIILISDGQGTPDHWNVIGDTVDPNNALARSLVNKYLDAAGRLVQSSGHKLYSIMVGNYRKETLEGVANISGGQLIPRYDIGALLHSTKHQTTAAVYVHSFRNLGKDVDREPFLRALIGVDLTSPGETNLNKCTRDVLSLALKFDKHLIRGETLVYVMEEINLYMPCIGARVRRGPRWHWGNQDNGGPGTVVGHATDKMVWVEWDIGGQRFIYLYSPGVFGVTVVDEERQLVAGEHIAVGCNVKRGRDWRYGDDDGGKGTVGVVCGVNPDDTVYIRWPNMTIKRYNFGANGRFDVELINQRNPIETQASILPTRSRKETSQKNNEPQTAMLVEDNNLLFIKKTYII